MNRKYRYLFVLLFLIFPQLCLAASPWELKLLHETPKLTNRPFYLNTGSDLNKNGKKEIIAADFGNFGHHMNEASRQKDSEERWKGYHYLYVLEWSKDKLKVRFKKPWHYDLGAKKPFLAAGATNLVSWEIGDRVVVEAIPSYFSIEWLDGGYVLREQKKTIVDTPTIGSWVFPWMDPACHYGFTRSPKDYIECMVAIRDFRGDGNPKIITVIRTNNSMKSLRVRSYEPGFPLEWEKQIPRYFLGRSAYQAKLDMNSSLNLLLRDLRSRNLFLFSASKKDKEYSLRLINMKDEFRLQYYDLPDIYIGRTRDKDLQEYWGYMEKEIQHHDLGGLIFLLQKVVTNAGFSKIDREDVPFEAHENSFGLGYFIVKDIDSDGLDEVILLEETAGKHELGSHNEALFSDIKDYIHILKWDGKQYKTMWVSPPYTKRGTKFLVEDIKGNGKKQLVVLSSHGTIQVWERK